MKQLLILLLCLVLVSSALFAQQLKHQITEVGITSFGELGDCKYHFTERGFIEMKTASGIKDSAIQKIEKSYWNRITSTLGQINIDSLNFYPAPTNFREIDGDWHSYITVVTSSEKYITPYFDASRPNKTLSKLDSILWASGNHLSLIDWDSLYNLREEEDVELVYQLVDEMPSFKGGRDSLSVYLISRLKENNIYNGKAFVRCIVKKDGQLEDIELMKADNDLIGKTSLNIVRAMPNWVAGTERGKPVDVRIVIPIGYGFKYP